MMYNKTVYFIMISWYLNISHSSILLDFTDGVKNQLSNVTVYLLAHKMHIQTFQFIVYS